MKKNIKTEQKKETCVKESKGQVKAAITKGTNINSKKNAKIFEKASGNKVSSYNNSKLSASTINKAYDKLDKIKVRGGKK